MDDPLYQPTDAATYTVTYPEVINLNDRDIQFIKELILSAMRVHNITLATQAQQKIEEILHIKSRHENPVNFLQKVLADYNHLTSQM